MGFVPLFGRRLVDAGSRGHGSSAGRESVGVAPAGAWPQVRVVSSGRSSTPGTQFWYRAWSRLPGGGSSGRSRSPVGTRLPQWEQVLGVRYSCGVFSPSNFCRGVAGGISGPCGGGRPGTIPHTER